VLATLLFAIAVRASAQTLPDPNLLLHGELVVQRGRGSIDRQTGKGVLKVRRARLLLGAASNGIDPGAETLFVAIGEDVFTLPAGMLGVSRNGRVFSYRAPRPREARALHAFRLRTRPDGYHDIRLVVSGVDLFRLVLADPVCVPVTVIVGDDEGFVGANVTSPSFPSRSLSVRGTCAACSPFAPAHTTEPCE